MIAKYNVPNKVIKYIIEKVPFSLEKRDFKKDLYPLMIAIEIKMQKDPNENNEQNF